MTSDFKIGFFGDLRYEEMTIDLYYKSGRVCQISKDLGDENMIVEFVLERSVSDVDLEFKFPVDEFLVALNKAKEALKNDVKRQ